jgi:hypothetical protein
MCAQDEDSRFDSIEGRHLGTNSKSLSTTYFHISLANLNSELFSEKTNALVNLLRKRATSKFAHLHMPSVPFCII